MMISTNEDIKDGAIEVRLQRIMKPDVGSQKWRALFNNGESKWATLYRNDMDLLVVSGCDIRILTSNEEYVFKPEGQPLVRLMEDRGKFSLAGAWRSDHYITHEEGKALVTQNKPALASGEVRMETLNATVDKLIRDRKAERNEQRAAEQTLLAPADVARESAEIFEEVLLHVDTLMDRFGKVQLTALWRFRQSGTYRALKDSPQSVHDAIREMNLHQRDYTLALAYVVDRIFSEVDAAVKAEKPFLNPKTNLPITVEYLIATSGLILKLKKNSEYYGQLIDREAKQAFLGAIVTETAVKVDALREAGSKVSDTSMLIPFKVEPIPNSNRSRLILDVDEAQLRTVTRTLKALLA